MTIPFLGQSDIVRVGVVVRRVEHRFDNISDPDTPILQTSYGDSTQSKVISSSTHSAVTTSTTSFTCTSCTIVESGLGDDTSGSVTVYNVFAWKIDSNALIWAKWNQATSQYECFQAKCPA